MNGKLHHAVPGSACSAARLDSVGPIQEQSQWYLVCSVYMYICICYARRACMHARRCMFAGMYVCMYVRMYVGMYVRMYVCREVCMYVRTYVSM